MDNYLQKICLSLGIQLVYTKNKYVILSADIKNAVLTLRANNLFKNCPITVAKAIVSLYLYKNNREENEKIIRDYVDKLYPSNHFKIKGLDKDIGEEVKESIYRDKNFNQEDFSLVELEISSLIIKDFNGNEKKVSAHSEIETKNKDFLELDIVINPPST